MEEEKKAKVTIQRNQKYEDGKEVDDYLVIRYFPDEKSSWNCESFTMGTKNLKGLIEELQKKYTELKLD